VHRLCITCIEYKFFLYFLYFVYSYIVLPYWWNKVDIYIKSTCGVTVDWLTVADGWYGWFSVHGGTSAVRLSTGTSGICFNCQICQSIRCAWSVGRLHWQTCCKSAYSDVTSALYWLNKMTVRRNSFRTVPNFDGLSRENYGVFPDAELSRIPNAVLILSRFECNVCHMLTKFLPISLIIPILNSLLSNAFFRAQNAPNPFSAGLCPGPHWGSLQHSPRLLAGLPSMPSVPRTMSQVSVADLWSPYDWIFRHSQHVFKLDVHTDSFCWLFMLTVDQGF